MDEQIEIKIVCDNRDTETINYAIDVLKDRIERMGATYGTVEGDDYVIEIN